MQIIKVERCLGDKFRLTFPSGTREFVRAEKWDKKTAKEALDMLECVYHFERRKIRFYHV